MVRGHRVQKLPAALRHSLPEAQASQEPESASRSGAKHETFQFLYVGIMEKKNGNYYNGVI